MNNQKSTGKIFEILELFIEVQRDSLRLSEIAALSGLKTSTANRIASTLVDLGYLSQPQKRGKYKIGKKFMYFASLLGKLDTLKDLIRPYLKKLNDATGETVDLVNFYNNKLYFVENYFSRHSFNIVTDPIMVTPLHCSSAGKILLASFSDSELEKYFSNQEIKKYTPNTITDLNELKKHLAVVRQENIAFDDEELYTGVRSLASGIKDNQGVTFSCIAIIGPNVRLTRSKMKEMSEVVSQYTSEISREIGYKDA